MPAITSLDLSNAKLDVDHIAAIATSSAQNATDRLGHTKRTIAGAIADLQVINNNRGDWVTGTAYALRDLFTRSGIAYLVTTAHTSGDFNTDNAAHKFIIFQGAPNIGTSLNVAFPGAPIKNYANATFIFDGESTNSPAAGGTGWVEVVMGMSNFSGRGSAHYVAVPGRNMADTFAAYAANVRPLIQAALAEGRAPFVFLQSGLNDYGLVDVNSWTVPFDQYVTAVQADGGILVPMLCTRRQDAASRDLIRQGINNHILELGNPLTVPTDRIFTDPAPTGGAGFDPQSDDGIHPNPRMYAKIAASVNEIMAAGAGLAHIPSVWVKREFAGSSLPYINALQQIATDPILTMALSTNTRKDLAIQLTNSFSEAGKTAIRLAIPGDFKNWEIAAIGDTSDFSDELSKSMTFFDIATNRPLMSLSVYNGTSTLYGNWAIRRAVGQTLEPVSTAVAYPTANNTPGKPGQIAVKGDKSKIAVYAGDGVSSHSWAVSAATTTV